MSAPAQHADDWARLERAIGALLASPECEIHEDGEWRADLTAAQFELQRSGSGALLHLWSGEANLVRRIVAVTQISPQHMVLEVQRFGRAKPGKLEILRIEKVRAPGRISREKFRARLRRMLAEQFPDSRMESLTTAPDLEHSLSGVYARGVLKEAARRWAVLASPPGEDARRADDALTFALLWLDWLRQRSSATRDEPVYGLRLLFPKGASGVTQHRARALSPSLHLEIFEYAEDDGEVRRIEETGGGNLASWLTSRRAQDAVMANAGTQLEMARASAAELGLKVEAVVRPGTETLSLRYRGLEFAHWQDGRLLFGCGEILRELTPRSADELRRLLEDLREHRSGETPDVNHSLYRAAPEKWLETVIVADPSRISAQVEPQHVYSQVPAFSASDRGVIDVLSVTRQGRLVVIELKASEDIHLPLQAMDYWLRVKAHHAAGDFHRYGYFHGVELTPESPLMWLVAPALRFHPSTDALLRYLSPEIQITRIGINETWRRDLQVVFRA